MALRFSQSRPGNPEGADRLKAITGVTNTGSAGFHRRLGFDVRQVEDYDGPGVPMMVMTRPLPLR
jgi:hypothetical protein